MTNKNKNILLGVLIVGVLSMTVAFAALSTRLNIQGTTNVAATKWNIHFKSWAKVGIPTVDGHNNTATSPEVGSLTMSQQTNTTKVEGINVVLNQPGDTAKYTFQIINKGTIDAKLSAFTPTITGDSGNKINYVVECKDAETETHIPTGNEITVNSVLAVNQTIYCSLEVTYKDYENSHTAGQDQTYHQDAINASISAAWTWVQNDGASSPATSSTPTQDPEPNTPVVNSWDTYYTPSNPDGDSTLDDDSQYWIQENTIAHYKQVCNVFDNSIVCLTNNQTGYASNFANVSTTTENITTAQALEATGLRGYSLTKAEEMLSAGVAGATFCNVRSDYVGCFNYVGDKYCYIDDNGNVECGSDFDGHYCDVNYNGSSFCE